MNEYTRVNGARGRKMGTLEIDFRECDGMPTIAATIDGKTDTERCERLAPFRRGSHHEEVAWMTGRASWSRLVLMPLVMSLAACASSTVPEIPTPRDQVDLVGRWQDTTGADAADGADGVLTLAAFTASTSCSQTDPTVFLDLAWPAGSRVNVDDPNSPHHHYSYVRDPHGSYWTTDQPDLDTTLPSDVVASGLRRAGNELYVNPSDPSAIWLHRPDGHIERWPQQKPDVGCA